MVVTTGLQMPRVPRGRCSGAVSRVSFNRTSDTSISLHYPKDSVPPQLHFSTFVKNKSPSVQPEHKSVHGSPTGMVSTGMLLLWNPAECSSSFQGKRVIFGWNFVTNTYSIRISGSTWTTSESEERRSRCKLLTISITAHIMGSCTLICHALCVTWKEKITEIQYH